MNVFTFPFYREGLGLVLMEAGAMNIPSISSDITGCREIIFNYNNGLLINSKDQQDLFNKMRYFIENQDQINEMAKKARNIVKDKFEQKELWKKS
jgi:glycosyltransferase involved in cell wall biosynthesis